MLAGATGVIPVIVQLVDGSLADAAIGLGWLVVVSGVFIGALALMRPWLEGRTSGGLTGFAGSALLLLALMTYPLGLLAGLIGYGGLEMAALSTLVGFVWFWIVPNVVVEDGPFGSAKAGVADLDPVAARRATASDGSWARCWCRSRRRCDAGRAVRGHHPGWSGHGHRPAGTEGEERSRFAVTRRGGLRWLGTDFTVRAEPRAVDGSFLSADRLWTADVPGLFGVSGGEVVGRARSRCLPWGHEHTISGVRRVRDSGRAGWGGRGGRRAAGAGVRR
ncbi:MULTISPECIES: hypothetical protein [unclassified Streptomyces]|uniref:hypothetical protein n=1 Tax=unclassified Streptomyces TaxID=2593676 RepID=UPI000DC7A6A0|nr:MULTISPECIES: hypothetical protein [unclassified Streptomyces]AWZ09477.1 hypothetical protein DRB89_39115 [Streptomyces sp. ICC4]AWZ17231.1 hypothetical protein DRB96_39525 [Streptomyces sp. ICC1]